MFFGGNDLDILETCGPQTVGHELRRALDIRAMLGQSTDARDAQETLQFIKKSFFVGLDKRVCGCRHDFSLRWQGTSRTPKPVRDPRQGTGGSACLTRGERPL